MAGSFGGLACLTEWSVAALLAVSDILQEQEAEDSEDFRPDRVVVDNLFLEQGGCLF